MITSQQPARNRCSTSESCSITFNVYVYELFRIKIIGRYLINRSVTKIIINEKQNSSINKSAKKIILTEYEDYRISRGVKMLETQYNVDGKQDQQIST